MFTLVCWKGHIVLLLRRTSVALKPWTRSSSLWVCWWRRYGSWTLQATCGLWTWNRLRYCIRYQGHLLRAIWSQWVGRVLEGGHGYHRKFFSHPNCHPNILNWESFQDSKWNVFSFRNEFHLFCFWTFLDWTWVGDSSPVPPQLLLCHQHVSKAIYVSTCSFQPHCLKKWLSRSNSEQ